MDRSSRCGTSAGFLAEGCLCFTGSPKNSQSTAANRVRVEDVAMQLARANATPPRQGTAQVGFSKIRDPAAGRRATPRPLTTASGAPGPRPGTSRIPPPQPPSRCTLQHWLPPSRVSRRLTGACRTFLPNPNLSTLCQRPANLIYRFTTSTDIQPNRCAAPRATAEISFRRLLGYSLENSPHRCRTSLQFNTPS